MEKINSTILKTAIEAIPLLTMDNYTLWKNRVENMLDLQELLKPLTSENGVLSNTEDVQLRTILTSKLEASIHANVITHENEKSSKKIWKSISDYFASSQASNRARIFNAVLHVQFNPNDVLEFITQVKTAISRLHEVGIILPKDIIAYLILHKLPPSMTNISQQITHSDKEITPELVLDHLRLYANDQQILVNSGGSNKQTPVSLLTDEEKKCRRGWHNPNANHPKPNCWFLYPHLRPSYEDKKTEASVSSFHSSLSKLNATFVLDSGSSSHMVYDVDLFISLDSSEEGCVKTSSGNDSLSIKGIGTIKLSNEYGNFFLSHVLYVPQLVVNLLSFLSAAEELHKALGHVSYARIKQKLGIPLKNITRCEACALGKITKASFKSKHQRASRPFEELHLDLIGPISPTSREGDRYILTVVDSNTRYCSATPINLKSDVYETLSNILNYEAKRFGYYPSVLHSDRGREFINSTMEEYCKEHLIKCRTSDPYTPQQNGLAERHNRTIIESLRTILTDSKINRRYWSDIVKTPGSKLYPKGSKGRLIGYNEELQSYHILADDGRIVDTKSGCIFD
ncbi:hypothetical protein VP01_251g9 [Puccinia sorghi]|uniref:Integrase catalytic domain-containing protein n=1 Tax=Puccinia sorghi TaxID=27349 RepID=A0A0L6V657_9BASI|nr:hypothetical protein VP01_251g9 [Puccinia sorghi]